MNWSDNFWVDWFFIILPIHVLVVNLLLMIIKTIRKKHLDKWWCTSLIMLLILLVPLIVLGRNNKN